MSINGNLKTMELSELLQWLAHGTKTGTLEVKNGQVEKKIFFDNGSVVMTASSDPKEYLGHFLVSRGLIDEVVLAQAMAMQDKNKMLLGKILVTIGAISEPDLNRMLLLKLEETVYEMFTWSKGEFHFVDDNLPEFTMIPLRLNLNAVILEGVRRADDWKRIRADLPSMQYVPVTIAALDSSQGDALKKKVLELIDDDRTIEEIALHSRASAFHVCRILLDQVEGKRLKLVRPRSVEVAAAVATNNGNVDTDSLLKSAKQHLDESQFEKALRHYRAALSLEPHEEAIQTLVAEAEGVIRAALEANGITPNIVPMLARSLEELPTLDISPQEGFILSRVNNTYDIQTILKISPMPPLDALLVFRRLKSAGHVTFGSEVNAPQIRATDGGEK